VETDPDLEMAAFAGSELTQEEVADLEELVRRDRTSTEPRARLAGYYYRYSQEPGVRAKRRALVFWFMREHPTSRFAGSPCLQLIPETDPTGYRQVRSRWLKLAEGTKDTAILRNVASFFRFPEPRMQRNYLQRAERLEPAEPAWKRLLGVSWGAQAQHARTEKQRRAAAHRALTYYQNAYRLTQGEPFKWYLLSHLAETALLAGKMAQASRHARLLLSQAASFPGDWNYGNALYVGNEVLGLIAFKRRRLADARKCLLAAGATPGSPQLNSFGPSFKLARLLLEAGERELVLKYIELCSKFWDMGQQKLSAWAAEIQSGGLPSLSRY
jgi:hypothetical protein